MIWVRKGFVHLLALVLLVSLVGGAFAVSAKLNFTHPAKLETWLNESNFYSSFVTNELHDAQQSASNDQGAGRVSLSDPAVEQAVGSVFSSGLLQQYVTTFLNSNYAWLEGKTAVPDFRIDLTPAKRTLAQQVGKGVEIRVTGLPACSAAQLAQLQSTLETDPLSIPCRPPSLSPQIAGTQATTQINESSDFLNQTVLTANALDPNGGQQAQPYYQKLSTLPKLYRLNLKLPWIFGGLALLSALGIVFVSPGRRRGVRRIGWVLVIAGVILVAVKLVADSAFNHVQKKIFTNSNLGQLQQSLTDFLHRLETQLVRTDLWFGVVYLILAILVLGSLWLTRQKAGPKKPKTKTPSSDDENGGQGTDDRPPLPVFKQPPRSPKRPRLIQ